MRKRASIGQAELEVLQYVQEHHPVTLRQVADHLAAARGVVRTTVLNVLTRLCRKGYLSRRKVEGVFHYAPKVAKGQVLRGLVRDFVQGALGGSVSPFVAYLANEATVTDEELAELRQLVAELERREEGGKP
jgi:predicted transcriptional regulator